MKTITFKENTITISIDPSFIGMVKLRPNGEESWRIELTLKSGHVETLLFPDIHEAENEYRRIISSMEA